MEILGPHRALNDEVCLSPVGYIPVNVDLRQKVYMECYFSGASAFDTFVGDQITAYFTDCVLTDRTRPDIVTTWIDRKEVTASDWKELDTILHEALFPGDKVTLEGRDFPPTKFQISRGVLIDMDNALEHSFAAFEWNFGNSSIAPRGLQKFRELFPEARRVLTFDDCFPSDDPID